MGKEAEEMHLDLIRFCSDYIEGRNSRFCKNVPVREFGLIAQFMEKQGWKKEETE